MKKLILGMFFCLFFVPAVAFGSPQQNEKATVAQQTTQQNVVDENSIAGSKDPDLVPMQRGCCSWHGGVSGCGDNGRVICNDGTYSPSCRC